MKCVFSSLVVPSSHSFCAGRLPFCLKVSLKSGSLLFIFDVYTVFDLIQCARWMQKNEPVLTYRLINIFMVDSWAVVSFSLVARARAHTVRAQCYCDHCVFPTSVHSLRVSTLLVSFFGDFISHIFFSRMTNETKNVSNK